MPGKLFTNICFILTWSKKFKYDTRRNFDFFVPFVSEAITRGCSIERCTYEKLTYFAGTWRIDLVSPNKNHKIPKNTWYFKAHLSTVSAYLQQITNSTTEIVLRKFVRYRDLIAFFLRFRLNVTRNFWAPGYPLNLNVCKVTAGKRLCQSIFCNKATTIIKKRFWNRCVCVNYTQFLRTPICRTFSKGCFRCFFSSYIFFHTKSGNTMKWFSNYINVNPFMHDVEKWSNIL